MRSKQILSVSSGTSFPPRSGGHLRTYNINLELSKKEWEIFQFSACVRKSELYKLQSFVYKINGNYIEYRYFNPITMIFNHIFEKMNLPPLGFLLIPITSKILRKKIDECDLIIVEHPWLFKKLYLQNKRCKPIIQNSHNLEYLLYKQRLSDKCIFKKKILNYIFEIEKFAFQNSDLNFVCSKEEKQSAINLYEILESKIEIVPNGVNTSKFLVIGHKKKESAKKKLGLFNKKVVLFTGAKYQPNVEAVKQIIQISKKMDDDSILLIIAGTVGEGFKNTQKGNLLFTGYVKNIRDYFEAADIAINPMLSGGGTNIKMLEYLASGLPTITTFIGARGLGLKNGVHAIITDLEKFPQYIQKLLEDEKMQQKLCWNGKKLTEDNYNWKKISERVIKTLSHIL